MVNPRRAACVRRRRAARDPTASIAGPMSVEERLAYERRVGMRQAVIAGVAGVLLVAAVAVQLGGAHAKVDEQTLGLITENKRIARDVIGAGLDAIGYFALAATLWYLWGVTRARNPDVKPPFVGYIAVAGGILTGISIPAYVALYAVKAHDFATHGAQTYAQANHLISSSVLVLPQLGNYLGVLLAAIGVVLVALNAMRVGLLTRFMGFLGIFAGVLVIFPLVPIPIVEGFWLVALGYLFSGRWPTGVPPAWRSGRAEPWPSSAEMREQRQRTAGGGRGGAGGGFGRPKPSAKPAPEPVAAPAPSPGRTRSTTPKRKRKRRH
jgi:Domain of unknown function (DUF4386)